MNHKGIRAGGRGRPVALGLRRLLWPCAACAIALAWAATAAEGVPAADKAEARAGEKAAENAEITADSMEADFAARVAKFEGDVLVTDSRMSLRTDRLMAYFAEDNKLLKLEAMGDVVISQPDADRTATAGYAEYDVKAGTISLMEKPELRTGENTVTGADKIIYYRDTETVKTVGGRPRFRVVPKGHDKALEKLLRTQEKRREDAVKVKYKKTGRKADGRKDGR